VVAGKSRLDAGQNDVDLRFQTDNAGYFPLKQGPFLFDLELDPNESYSLIDSEPGVAAELAATLDAWEGQMAANLRGWWV
jgi:hypothetical protein